MSTFCQALQQKLNEIIHVSVGIEPKTPSMHAKHTVHYTTKVNWQAAKHSEGK
jgi:hypothetical protein